MYSDGKYLLIQSNLMATSDFKISAKKPLMQSTLQTKFPQSCFPGDVLPYNPEFDPSIQLPSILGTVVAYRLVRAVSPGLKPLRFDAVLR